jgi:hypothetical protein
MKCGLDKGTLCLRAWDGTEAIPPKADTMPPFKLP